MSHIVKIISERKKVTNITYSHCFQQIGESEGIGYNFPCDKYGNLDETDEYYDTWIKSYKKCIENPNKYEDRGIIKETWQYIDNAKALCSCGKRIDLWDQYQGACECPNCNQWYNLFGQALIDPEYWEEE